uniref:Zinc finger protein 276 n=1 Tax=Latimeria chalumnae TaxID=7897 RepID=H3AY13_LATCH
GVGRTLTTGYCRLCHGKFSSRSLRKAFGKVPVMEEDAEKQRQAEHTFYTDFQCLVGVVMQQDPALPQFVCKNCHAQFYKCRSILRTFIQRVNTSPTEQTKPKGRRGYSLPAGTTHGGCRNNLITSSPQSLHSLVSWTHSHAGNCKFVPSLQNVLSSRYCGIIQAMWNCGDGHSYSMRADSDLSSNALSVKDEGECNPAHRASGNGTNTDSTPTRVCAADPPLCTAQCRQSPNSEVPITSPRNAESQPRDLPFCFFPPLGQVSDHQDCPPAPEGPVKAEPNDLSDGDFLSEDEDGEKRHSGSSDESFDPYPEKNKVANKKSERKEPKKPEEPKVRKKPGPKPGWKKKIKLERYQTNKCYKIPFDQCNVNFRKSAGYEKHIKEHHEEMRERPCPHPGCNKVFMIDRYLQRHVKLIHTEVRNYICDECGQTFKQRKHLSVHQMRHSGAKPLQCEICGFQCRQRASLKYHMTKHKAETELEFACDQCSKRFEKAHNLNVHMSMVHPLTQNTDKAKPPETEQVMLVEATPAPETIQEAIQGPIVMEEPS